MEKHCQPFQQRQKSRIPNSLLRRKRQQPFPVNRFWAPIWCGLSGKHENKPFVFLDARGFFDGMGLWGCFADGQAEVRQRLRYHICFLQSGYLRCCEGIYGDFFSLDGVGSFIVQPAMPQFYILRVFQLFFQI